MCLILLVAPAAASPRHARAWHVIGVAITLLVALFTTSATTAYIVTGVGLLLHAWRAFPVSRVGGVSVAVAACASMGVTVALGRGDLTTGFVLSCVAIAVAAGVMPLHIGAASLCDRLPVLQAGNLSSLIALVFVHLRYVDHHPGAIELAPLVVRYGATACITGALLALVQTDLRGFYRGTMSMHAGMLLAAVGTASLGNYAAALLVAIAMGLALGGLGIVIASLEERTGSVRFAGPGGRANAFPRLAASFAVLGGAGVAIPGTAGFMADDLLLHTLWMVSPTSTVVMILSSAFLAVATLGCIAAVFFGRATPSLAPDLHPRERMVVVVLVTLLLLLGFTPGLLLGPADVFLTPAPQIVGIATP